MFGLGAFSTFPRLSLIVPYVVNQTSASKRIKVEGSRLVFAIFTHLEQNLFHFLEEFVQILVDALDVGL